MSTCERRKVRSVTPRPWAASRARSSCRAHRPSTRSCGSDVSGPCVESSSGRGRAAAVSSYAMWTSSSCRNKTRRDAESAQGGGCTCKRGRSSRASRSREEASENSSRFDPVAEDTAGPGFESQWEMQWRQVRARECRTAAAR
eukprot:77377-Prymnesium_polylepis.1